MDSSTFNAVFFLSLGTMILGSFGLIVRYSLRSRCVKCSFCYGLIVIDRDIQAEIQEEQFEITHGINEIPATPRPAPLSINNV